MSTLSYQKRQAAGMIGQWKRSKYGNLNDAYKTGGSDAKRRAWRHCERTCEALKGTDLKVVSKSVNFFSAGFQFVNPETGVVQFYFITASYEIAVDMI